MGSKWHLVYYWTRTDRWWQASSLRDKKMLVAWNSFKFFLFSKFLALCEMNTVLLEIVGESQVTFWFRRDTRFSPLRLKLKEERCKFWPHHGRQLLPASSVAGRVISDSKMASESFRERVAGDKCVVLIWVVFSSRIHSQGIAVSFPFPTVCGWVSQSTHLWAAHQARDRRTSN